MICHTLIKLAPENLPNEIEICKRMATAYIKHPLPP